MSEIFGRVRIVQIANLFFLVFNIACGFSHNTGQFLAFRFLAGFGGSAPLSVSG
jgi:MFS family permease